MFSAADLDIISDIESEEDEQSVKPTTTEDGEASLKATEAAVAVCVSGEERKDERTPPTLLKDVETISDDEDEDGTKNGAAETIQEPGKDERIRENEEQTKKKEEEKKGDQEEEEEKAAANVIVEDGVEVDIFHTTSLYVFIKLSL